MLLWHRVSCPDVKELEKASESSWHAIWNLSDRTAISRNEEVSYRKRKSRRQEVRCAGGGEPMVPLHLESEVQESALGASSWHQCGCSHDEAAVRLLQWVFMQQALTRGKQKGRSWKMPSVDFTAGKWVWLGSKISNTMTIASLSHPLTGSRGILLLCVLHPQRRALLVSSIL